MSAPLKVAIASGKGGTGKTTLSVNIASMLAASEEIVIADLDVEEPDSGIFITGTLIEEKTLYKMIPQWDQNNCTLCGYCQDVCNFHAVIQIGPQILIFPELCHSCHACSELCPFSALPMKEFKMGILRYFKSGNIHFVEGKLDIGQEQAVPLISQVNKYLDSHFRNGLIMIYDSPPGTSCPVIEATKNTDYVILVTEPTPFGMHDLKLAIATLKQLDKPFGVVINRYGIGNDEVIGYCNKEEINILARIPNSRRIAELYSQGRLIYNETLEIRVEFEKLCNYIVSLKKGVTE